MDDAVDKKYKNKHFPPSSSIPKPAHTNPSNASSTVPNTAHHSLDGHPQTLKQLIAGCSGASIEAAPPAIEGTPTLPCPISNLPDEILVHIFTDVAINDVAALVRLAQVCKKMTYLALTEEQIWKRICLGDEVGFGAMHYQWQREVLGAPLQPETPELQAEPELPDLQDLTINNVTVDVNLAPTELPLAPLSREAITESLLITAYRSSWQHMFRNRPRIRFNGCYISTVNYIRPGQASTSQLTWQSPVHIVTYYRYLRFFRDGTVISLLTTEEPADVVHHLTKELQETHRGAQETHRGAVGQHLPTSFMQHALKGRWRLSNSGDNPGADMKDAEGDVFIETEGAHKKYMYRMQLLVRSAGKGSRNNKLVWQGFWNYNILTDDIGVFTLRNDKAFFFSRVKSYGAGA
jgi:F-box protein 9